MPIELPGYWPYVVGILSAVVGVVAAVHAAMTKDDVRAAIAWVGVIMLSPLIGAFLYMAAGINRIRRAKVGLRRLRVEGRHGRARAAPREDRLRLPKEPHVLSMKRLGDQVSPFPLTGDNAIDVLNGGDEAFPAMLEAISGARRHIVVSTYIFDNDAIGRVFADSLAAAQDRGVEVRVLIDAVGARYSRPSIVGLLREAGVATELFLGGIIGFRLPYANLRNHRKVMVVDGRIAFTGGMNIRASFSSDHAGRAPDRDMHFAVRGPVVEQLLSVFIDDWAFVAGETLEGPVWAVEHSESGGSSAARVVVTGPDAHLEATHSMLMGAIAVARESIAICSPYFLPDQQLVGSLNVAARRGVAVDILIPSTNNLRLVDFAMTAQLDQMIRAGCRVWRSSGSFDHSKLMTVDGLWSYVGSSNIDPRSLRLNFELDLEVYDPRFAKRLSAHIGARIAEGWQETLETLRARPFLIRLRNRIVWLASPYL